jgi:hypothetical protein
VVHDLVDHQLDPLLLPDEAGMRGDDFRHRGHMRSEPGIHRLGRVTATQAPIALTAAIHPSGARDRRKNKKGAAAWPPQV